MTSGVRRRSCGSLHLLDEPVIRFGSEEFLDRVCRDLRKSLKEEIGEIQAELRKKLQSSPQTQLMLQLDGNRKRLAMLPSVQKAMLAMLRIERVRVNKIWRATGCGTARRCMGRSPAI